MAWKKCIQVSSVVCLFVIFSIGLIILVLFIQFGENDYGHEHDTIILSRLRVQTCDLEDQSTGVYEGHLKSPSLKSYIQASTTVQDQELRLSGLAVFSKLANACQPLVDVSKSNVQVNKIALISLANKTPRGACSLQELALNAQNAGYSVVIYCGNDYRGTHAQTEDKLLIPVAYMGGHCQFTDAPDNEHYVYDCEHISQLLLANDQTNVEIRVQVPRQRSNDLRNMEFYLESLYFWFLLGPIITLEWLRRTKKLCCMSGGQHVDNRLVDDEERATGNEETVVNVGETDLHSVAEETPGNYDQLTEAEELQPLITVMNDSRTNLSVTSEHTHRHIAIHRRVTTFFGNVLKICMSKVSAVAFVYAIAIIAALPVGISSGGLSFFRFDENTAPQTTFWDDLLSINTDMRNITPQNETSYWESRMEYTADLIIGSFIPLWWSLLQLFCFFMYSQFACQTTWTIPTDFSKLIRSDWFASNIYLLILGVVVPYCSLPIESLMINSNFLYFTTYNTICTICNMFFIIILNKHKFVTRYVFYISACMICAYIESDIVAVFYFMLNSQGSLMNLKLTALRTVAIGLTLTLSLNTSMHIIRKLIKPQKSLFEGLSEK